MNETAIQVFERAFKGQRLRAFPWDGKLGVIALELAEVLEYAHPAGFVRKLTNDWGDIFVEGVHYDRISGEALDNLRKICDDRPGYRKARMITVLYESGVNLALLKSNSPVATEIQLWLAEEVMPQLHRTNRYNPGTRVGDGQARDEKLALAFEKERRLMQREERLSRKLDMDAAKLVLEYCERFGLDEDIKAAYTAHALEVVAGKPLPDLKPACEWADWLSATEIGEKAGVSANKVARVAKSSDSKVRMARRRSPA